MSEILDVPPQLLIESIAKELKEVRKLQQPSFAPFVKTGAHRERAPQNPDWWFVRCASILRRLYLDGANGTGGLRSYYGGRRARGTKPHEFRKASGKIIRVCLQSLEKEGLLKKAKKGRVVSAKGEQLLQQHAKRILPTADQEMVRRHQDKLKKLMEKRAKKSVSIEEKKEFKRDKKEKKKDAPEKGDDDDPTKMKLGKRGK